MRHLHRAAVVVAVVLIGVWLYARSSHPVEVTVRLVDIPRSSEIVSVVDALRAGRQELPGGARVQSVHRLHPTAGEADRAVIGAWTVEVALDDDGAEALALGLRLLDGAGEVKVDTDFRVARDESFVVVGKEQRAALAFTAAHR